MKLGSGAVAALSLGPGMRFSDLMQAALRMRQLPRGQSLVIAMPAEVERLLRQVCGLADDAAVQGEHVLKWALHNTIERSNKVSSCRVFAELLHHVVCHGHTRAA